ncbi:hypothetical protein PR048_028863 [Dryococelus australis]|uniref:Uncharacterized protein n=1 Tax=Dryococelus australis TaxID=614101 RepID=A0ABQ9GBR3_9NEOP|nr:hypothetical protein PR048_028863 [Dryococelus australis]
MQRCLSIIGVEPSEVGEAKEWKCEGNGSTLRNPTCQRQRLVPHMQKSARDPPEIELSPSCERAWSSAAMQWWRKREFPKFTRQPVASYGTIRSKQVIAILATIGGRRRTCVMETGILPPCREVIIPTGPPAPSPPPPPSSWLISPSRGHHPQHSSNPQASSALRCPREYYSAPSLKGKRRCYVTGDRSTPRGGYYGRLPPEGAAVAERLACSPPTKANRFQSPAGALPDFRYAGIVPDDAAGRRVFSGSSRFPALTFRRCSILTSLHPLRLSRPRLTSFCWELAVDRDVPLLYFQVYCGVVKSGMDLRVPDQEARERYGRH